jgi:hypothetical protein
LSHNEYHGERYGTCKFQRMNDCWYNSVVPLVSRDGGQSFERLKGAEPAARIPQSYSEAQGRRAGVFHPTNIVRRGGHYFVLAEYRSPTRLGTCAYRTDDLWSGRPWDVWDGEKFIVTGMATSGVECRPLAKLSGLLWGIAYIEKAQHYIGLVSYRSDRHGRVVLGLVSSRDLIQWSEPSFVIDLPHTWNFECSDSFVYSYFSILDPSSSDRMYGVIEGRTARVFAMRAKLNQCKYGLERDLVSWDVQLQN